MRILGIETSCDDTAAAIIEARGGLNKPSFSVLSNISYSQVAIHKKFGGIVPNLASRAHLEKIAPTVKAALLIPRINSADIDLIAVTRGPGLLPSLLVGVNFARALAYKWQKPIIGVNHIEGHIYSNWLNEPHLSFQSGLRARSGHGVPRSGTSEGESLSTARWDVREKREKIGAAIFPALILIVSGGHTELVMMKNYGKYKIIGETLDDAAGECFDKTARILGLEFPGGPAIARLAERWKSEISNQKSKINSKYKIQNTKYHIKLPRPIINSKDYNFSFSGLKTAVLYLYNNLVAQGVSSNIMRPVIAAEIQNAIIDVLAAKTIKAVKNYNPKSVMIAGGVAANKKLRKDLVEKIAPYKIPLFIPDLAYTTDNAAMIAAAGYFNYLKKKSRLDSWKKVEVSANLKLNR